MRTNNMQLKPTNPGFLVMLLNIHGLINMEIMKSSSFTFRCFKLSEMWSAFLVPLKLKIKDFLHSHVYWEHSVDCRVWLMKFKRFHNHPNFKSYKILRLRIT